MAFIFHKFQEAVKTLAKSPTFARDPRQLQFETDMHRLFLYTSFNRLGSNANEADAEEIIDMASKASVSEQQKQVQENIHSQMKRFCISMDEMLLRDLVNKHEPVSHQSDAAPRRSGLSFAVGKSGSPTECPGEFSFDRTVVPETRPLKCTEVSQRLKNIMGYTLDVRPSQIPHKEAGQGLFLDGEAGVGALIAIYPGVIYYPAYYRYIPGYPRVDAQNPYLITRYDGTVINAQPWGYGGESREVWDGLTLPEIMPNIQGGSEKGSDRIWKLLSKPIESTRRGNHSEVLERRNPLALAHFANHPAKGMVPNVMICPYDFPLTEQDMRPYIPNVSFGNTDEVNMRRFGSFWFRWGSSSSGSGNPVLKTLVLVATRTLGDEEVLLNYRLSNSKRRPAWYTPVDEEEDRRRWS